MSPTHTARTLSHFAWTLGLLSAVVGYVWLAVSVDWLRPWLVGWFIASCIVTPLFCVFCAINERSELEEDRV